MLTSRHAMGNICGHVLQFPWMLQIIYVAQAALGYLGVLLATYVTRDLQFEFRGKQ